jgi:prevent-host-death family protein
MKLDNADTSPVPTIDVNCSLFMLCLTSQTGQNMKKKQKSRAISTADRSWQLQTAKARFSELFRKARAEGPQLVTRQGKDAVVVVAAEEFQRLKARSRQPESLVEFFAKSPLAGANLELDRPRDYGREVDL